MLAKVSDEPGQLPEAVEVEQVRGGGRRRSRGGSRVIGSTKGDGGMAAVRQANDDVRAGAVPDADDGQSLPAEGMMGMGDRHRSRRRRGERGSALGLCPRSLTAWRR